MRQTGSQDYVFADHFAWETAKEAFRRSNQEKWKDDLAFRLQKAWRGKKPARLWLPDSYLDRICVRKAARRPRILACLPNLLTFGSPCQPKPIGQIQFSSKRSLEARGRTSPTASIAEYGRAPCFPCVSRRPKAAGRFRPRTVPAKDGFGLGFGQGGFWPRKVVANRFRRMVFRLWVSAEEGFSRRVSAKGSREWV